jgi:metal-responsive CopG/Arc/MetJ family transcriptional regulator
MVKPKPPEPYRVAIPIPPDLLAKIDEYRWRNRLPSRAAAIRDLLEKALAAKPKA